ncbi:HupE/UreJ family protein [Gammaproteobacteria bacterium]|nr:HupE/UreJ family protein [Gammaproteobacteria bacterium]
MHQRFCRVLILALCSSSIFAHEFNPAHLVVDEVQNNTYKVNWMYPSKNIGSRAGVLFPVGCQREGQSPIQKGKYLVETLLLTCDQSLKGQVIEVRNLSVLTDALVTISHLNGEVFEGLINLKRSSLTVPLKEQVYPLGYFSLGIDHLMSGKDHILFILGLLFLVSGLLNTIKTITAFTLAHSVTLGLSVFEIVALPQATVEAIIALTIIYLAIEISDRKRYASTPWLIAFGFGLLHGLGFANALTGIGIGNEQLFLSLLFFNLGIEAGQLLLLPIFTFLIWLAHRFNLYKQSATLTSLILGGMGFFWLIDRTLSILG